MKPASTVDEFLVAMAEKLSAMDLRGLLADGRLKHFEQLNCSQSHSGNWCILVHVVPGYGKPVIKVELGVGIYGTSNLHSLLQACFIRGVPQFIKELHKKKPNREVRLKQEELRREYLNKLLMSVLQAKIRQGLVNMADTQNTP